MVFWNFFCKIFWDIFYNDLRNFVIPRITENFFFFFNNLWHLFARTFGTFLFGKNLWNSFLAEIFGTFIYQGLWTFYFARTFEPFLKRFLELLFLQEPLELLQIPRILTETIVIFIYHNNILILIQLFAFF